MGQWSDHVDMSFQHSTEHWSIGAAAAFALSRLNPPRSATGPGTRRTPDLLADGAGHASRAALPRIAGASVAPELAIRVPATLSTPPASLPAWLSIRIGTDVPNERDNGGSRSGRGPGHEVAQGCGYRLVTVPGGVLVKKRCSR